eukprot:1584265-Alexandrium_andersonii.AAC.1
MAGRPGRPSACGPAPEAPSCKWPQAQHKMPSSGSFRARMCAESRHDDKVCPQWQTETKQLRPQLKEDIDGSEIGSDIRL